MVGAILAGLQVINGGAALGDVIGDKWFGLFALVVAAVQAGWQVYVSGVTVPSSNVAAVQYGEQTLAGPAAPQPDGTAVSLLGPPPG